MLPDIPTKARILAAARQEFLREGFSGARMQHIANGAGINKALLHYYYQSKENLFALVLGDALAAFIPKVQAIFSGAEGVMEKIEMYLDAHLELLNEQPDLPLFVISESHRDPEAFFTRFYGKSEKESPFRFFLQQINNEMEQGRIRKMDPVHLWLNIMSMTVFPFAARPMMRRLTGTSEFQYKELLSERKKHILGFINQALIIS